MCQIKKSTGKATYGSVSLVACDEYSRVAQGKEIRRDVKRQSSGVNPAGAAHNPKATTEYQAYECLDYATSSMLHGSNVHVGSQSARACRIAATRLKDATRPGIN